MARKPPMPIAKPMAPFCEPLATTWSTWLWTSTVVSGIHMKLLPNQKALRAVCLRFPKLSWAGAALATADMTQG